MSRSHSKKTNISSLKAKLSSFLQLVQRGYEIIILDRNLPIAKIVALQNENIESFEIIPPRNPDTSLKNIRGNKLSGKKTDVVSLLIEDREES